MFRIAGFAAVLLAGAVLAFAATRPDSFRVQRSASIQAPPEKDPNLNGNYGAVASGKGAVYAYQGNREGHNIVEFTLRPEAGKGGNTTRVTWAIQGPMPYVSKLFSLFVDMDAMIGKEFETGLADLKAIVER